jgi:hypothetical protein
MVFQEAYFKFISADSLSRIFPTFGNDGGGAMFEPEDIWQSALGLLQMR